MHWFIHREIFPLAMGFLPTHYKQLSTVPAYRYIKITHHRVNSEGIHSCFCNSSLESLQQHETKKYYQQILIIHDWVTKNMYSKSVMI